MTPMTDQQKQNLARILAMAKVHIEQAKQEAVKRSDFDTSFQIATNESKVEQYLKERGVTLPE